ncbi:thiamine diphosphokinase [Paenibacillus rigui]|uniref:Thiamine diphosphokinase n=1 Tax=Paenibacillus rigui TaxID=554312 RepID=A0A229UND4_9BACL|nr:thiamine diphosphokinase [Paenibacillus rigui]OXM84908.1 thiamine diphosphokinase [Paenibacillus rigui]
MSHPRIVIYSGGTLGSWALPYADGADLLVGADRGALFMLRHGLKPDIALGDFDSVSADELVEIERHSTLFQSCDPIDKDYTDTELAFAWALSQSPSEIIVCGGLGTRWDHSLANIHLLRQGLQAGVPCRMLDEHNEIMLIDQTRPLQLTAGTYPYVSLLPLTLDAAGITLQGFLYPLTDARLTIGQSLGISNVLTEPTGTITVKEGLLLVIQSGDPRPIG